MKVNILHLFPDLLDQYFDSGNIQCLRKRLQWRNIECEVSCIKRGDPLIDLSNTDIIFIGGGADKEQLYVCRHLLGYKTELNEYVQSGGSLLAICGGYQLLGKYYKLHDETINGLEILDIYTEQGDKRLIGNTVLECDFLDKAHNKVVGFENHGGRTHIGNHTPFGKVLYGHGNEDNSPYDGVIYKNLIGTYLHGPLLPKNPKLCDYILTNALKRRYSDFTELGPIDDELENKANKYITERFLKG